MRGRVQHLALQVRERNLVVIDDAERADAGGGEIEERRRTDPARADHKHARGPELRLALPADVAKHDMARVAIEFFRRQCHLCISQSFRSSAYHSAMAANEMRL